VGLLSFQSGRVEQATMTSQGAEDTSSAGHSPPADGGGHSAQLPGRRMDGVLCAGAMRQRCAGWGRPLDADGRPVEPDAAHAGANATEDAGCWRPSQLLHHPYTPRPWNRGVAHLSRWLRSDDLDILCRMMVQVDERPSTMWVQIRWDGRGDGSPTTTFTCTGIDDVIEGAWHHCTELECDAGLRIICHIGASERATPRNVHGIDVCLPLFLFSLVPDILECADEPTRRVGHEF